MSVPTPIQCLPATLLALFPVAALAQATTAQFNVQITITAECQINTAANLNFGSSGVLDANIDATSDITVQCTTGTPYNLGLSVGGGTGATFAARRMSGPGNPISYSLYTTAARNVVWGDSVGVNTRPGTGDGAPQTFTVYGRVPPQTTPTVGAYADTITATISY